MLFRSEFVNRFMAIRPNQFSREALAALFSHLEDVERVSGEDSEFDPIAISCDWTEYESALEAAEGYGFKAEDVSDDEKASKADRDALTFLCDETTVLELSSGAVVIFNY